MVVMVERKKQAMIGVFVLGALTLLVIGIALFGSGRYFTKYTKAIMYFDGSVKGLNIGSPVMAEGVKIGTVSDIRLIADVEGLSLKIPVIVDIDTKRFSTLGTIFSDKDYIDELIAKGLRAQLQTQSMVTGQLIINLGFYPESKFKLQPKKRERTLLFFNFDYPEIPTISSNSQALQQMIEGLPVRDLLDTAQSALSGVDRLVNSPELAGSVIELNKTLVEMRVLINNLNRELPSLAQNANQSFVAATGVIGRTDKWLVDNRDVVKSVASDLAKTTTQVRKTLETTEKTMVAVKSTVADERTLYQLQNTLREVAEAARSLRQLGDYLERHPDAIIRGRKEGG
jgi:paraquat-inducible protein B